MRSQLIAGINKINSLGSLFPGVINFILRNTFLAGLTKRMLGFATQRSFPALSKYTLKSWFKKYSVSRNNDRLVKGKVFLFADEFTNYHDTEIGIKTIKLLTHLGYKVELASVGLSGRTYLSKGLLRKAKKIANINVEALKKIISGSSPLIGIEPSAILSFRDEYPELVDASLKDASLILASFSLLIDEFIVAEFEKGKISKSLFTDENQEIRLHGHCHQKSIASTEATKKMLEIPANYSVEEIKSGCCGMAGAFGYEKEHYEISMKIGELVLFPEVRRTPQDFIIAAPGTSCRQQIFDGTGRKALHPVEVMYEALNPNS